MSGTRRYPSVGTTASTPARSSIVTDTTADTDTTTGGAGVCGDGVLDDGEGCDDGVDNGDMNSCTSECQLNICGDTKVGPGEGCDDGNLDDADECTNACALATCGDGIASVSELCDDGNADDTDLCTSACTPASCGDGFTQPVAGEACDDGNANADNADCTTLCNLAICGDSLLHDQGQGGETCDNGPENGPGKACNAMCALNVCGDGDASPTEGCDDGNVLPGDGCDEACVLEICGNSIVNVGEDCDDGQNGDPDDGCTDLCKVPACGDGLLQPSTGETCDLGEENSDSGACTLACQSATCGDGKIWAGMEACDDGDANAETNACLPGCTNNVCGDGFVLVGVEECDDNNGVDNDGCSNVCKSATCNDGVKNGSEVDIDCGGPACGICPSLLLLAGGNTGPNGTLGGTFTAATGWATVPLAGITVEGVALTMTTANLGVGLQRFTQIGNPQDNQLQYTTWDKGVWSPVAQLGINTTASVPSITAANTTAQAVFQGQDNNNYYTAYVNGAWTAPQMTGTSSVARPPDIAALGDNAVMFFFDNLNTNDGTVRPRNGGVWGVNTVLVTNNTTGYAPRILTLTSGPELLAMWPGGGPLRYSFRTAGVWSAAASVPAASPAAGLPPSLAALVGGAVGLAFRDANNKFQSYLWNGNMWQGPLPMSGNPTITGSPAIAPGIGSTLAEAAFIASGQVFHSRLSLLGWSVPVPLGGTDMRSVALARSHD